MSHSLSLYAKCLVNGKLYRVDLSHKIDGARFTLRPIDGRPYQVIFASAEKLLDRELFKLFPMFRCQLEPAQVQVNA